MKKILILLSLTLGINAISLAQINLNLYSQYTFSNKFDSYYDPRSFYRGTINDGHKWGAGLEYQLPQVGVEIMYLRMNTTAPITYADNQLEPDFAVFDLNLNYLMIGGLRHIESANGVLEGFGGIMGGLAIADLRNPDNGREGTATKLAWGARLGGIIWPTDVVGIKVQAQLLSAVQSVGGSFYFGSGGSGVDPLLRLA